MLLVCASRLLANQHHVAIRNPARLLVRRADLHPLTTSADNHHPLSLSFVECPQLVKGLTIASVYVDTVGNDHGVPGRWRGGLVEPQ